MFKRFIRELFLKFNINIERLKKRPDCFGGEKGRFSYQNKIAKFDIKQGQKVLDIGSGQNPFPFATVLVDRYLEKTRHRYEEIVTMGKPLVVADIAKLPFKDNRFDYVYCSHILEHVDDPISVSMEIIRVGNSGYIETPAMAKDMLFAWAKGMHKWHVVAIGQNLCFFEYSERQLSGVRSSIWKDIIFSKWYHPLQKMFYENLDLFDVMFCWHGGFTVFVFRLDGTVKSYYPKETV